MVKTPGKSAEMFGLYDQFGGFCLKAASGGISPLFKFGPDYRGTYKNNQNELENSIRLIRKDFF